jgi:hypothetical protein
LEEKLGRVIVLFQALGDLHFLNVFLEIDGICKGSSAGCIAL